MRIAYAVVALALYLIGGALAFGWRTFDQKRRTGDSGLRLDAGPTGSVGWWAKVAFVASLVLGLAGPLAALAGLAPLGFLEHAVAQLVGMLVLVAGVVSVLVAQEAMGASWRIGVDRSERTALVTEGLFGVVRNPIFTAMMLTTFGLAVLVPNVVTILALVVLIGSIEVQVRAVEEPYLLRTHGDAYRAYAAHVGRFFPRVGYLRTEPSPAG